MIWIMIGAILSGAFANQVANEFRAWTPTLVDFLISRAARKLPEDQRERYEEEWASYVRDIPGETGKVVSAIGLMFASQRMAWEFAEGVFAYYRLASAIGRSLAAV